MATLLSERLRRCALASAGGGAASDAGAADFAAASRACLTSS